MITIERNRNGSYTATALVTDAWTPFDWYESQNYYGYRKADVKALFRQHLEENKMTMKRGY